MGSIRHSTIVAVPDDPAYPVGTDEWNDPHVIDDETITAEMLAPGVVISGPTGATGPTGVPGNRWYTGVGLPSDGVGNDDDLYLNASNGDIYQKVSGTWF
jgi:hypothetical protein